MNLSADLATTSPEGDTRLPGLGAYGTKVRVFSDGAWIDGRNKALAEFFPANVGSTYKIEVSSVYHRTVNAIVQVDGLNIMDGTPLTDWKSAKGVVLYPGERSLVPGWRVGSDRWAEFCFAALGESYASKAGDPRATKIGTIEVLFVSGWVRGETDEREGVSVDVGTVFGKELRAPFRDLDFVADAPLDRFVVHYATATELDGKGVLSVAPAIINYCKPPEGWVEAPQVSPAKPRGRPRKNQAPAQGAGEPNPQTPDEPSI